MEQETEKVIYEVGFDYDSDSDNDKLFESLDDVIAYLETTVNIKNFEEVCVGETTRNRKLGYRFFDEECKCLTVSCLLNGNDDDFARVIETPTIHKKLHELNT